MSGLGHLAPALVAKAAAPNASVLALVVAAEANDLLYGVFSAAGLEPQAAIASMDFVQGVKYVAPVSDPLSHGLLMSLVWAASAAALAYPFFRSRRISAIFGLTVLSHWALDFLMHSNLPLLLDGSPLVGLGLENSGAGFLFMTILDLVLLAVGIVIYLRARRRTTIQTRARNDGQL